MARDPLETGTTVLLAQDCEYEACNTLQRPKSDSSVKHFLPPTPTRPRAEHTAHP